MEDLTEQIENKRKENDLLYSAIQDKNLVVLNEKQTISSNSSIQQRVDFKEALAKATRSRTKSGRDAERKLESERKDVTELICSFEEELKSKTEKIASLRLELANARSKNATSSFNVAPREVKKQQQQRKQSVLLNDPLDDEDDEEYYFEEQHHHHKQKTQKQDQYDEDEEKQEEYERSEELKRLDALDGRFKKNSRKKLRRQ